MFNHQCTASFEDPCNIVILELNLKPARASSTIINRHKVKPLRGAAALADRYVLTHKSVFDTNNEVCH